MADVRSAFIFSICIVTVFSKTVDPENFFDDFTQGAPLRYVINLTNCMPSPPFGPKMEDTFISDVISGGTLSSASHATWNLMLGNEKYINGNRYNLTAVSPLRVTSIPMSDQVQAYVYVYDLDPRSWKRLAVQDIICFTGQRKSEIAFVTTNQSKTPLYTYTDVSATLLSGGETTFSFNIDGKSPDDQFSYVVGRIEEFSFIDNDIVFSIDIPNELWVSVYRARLSRDNHVTLTSYQVNRKSSSSDIMGTYNGSIESQGSYRIYSLN
ncbi:uncharacterized protein LOC124135661 [Haliotis rufescens]|uniref:uncharacterized protein LOC124135661 n=1 Tax=Haliotis rufescens TaxID=6454 RepID=UPI001EB090C3|nr:uncharacterized protein LOC124135661 [Haliotis rufescens]